VIECAGVIGSHTPGRFRSTVPQSFRRGEEEEEEGKGKASDSGGFGLPVAPLRLFCLSFPPLPLFLSLFLSHHHHHHHHSRTLQLIGKIRPRSNTPHADVRARFPLLLFRLRLTAYFSNKLGLSHQYHLLHVIHLTFDQPENGSHQDPQAGYQAMRLCRELRLLRIRRILLLRRHVKGPFA
jgi:hypothetical protein